MLLPNAPNVPDVETSLERRLLDSSNLCSTKKSFS